MKDEIKKTLEKLEKDGWITISPHLNHDALAAAVFDITFREMTVGKFLEVMWPRE